MKFIVLMAAFAILWSCNENKQAESVPVERTRVKVVGAMKNVMQKGQLAGTMDLDTIGKRDGLYGLGPVEYLRGEILVVNGKAYVSTVINDSTMKVEETFAVKAPFFVYAHQDEWIEDKLPPQIRSLEEFEKYLKKLAGGTPYPFVFKLKGKIKSARIHVQNLEEGGKIESPDDAHESQVSYLIPSQNVEIIGFYSTEHKGVFTHHNTNLHLHLITADKSQMGHLDEVDIERMIFYLPK